jgi:hypothetical protein
MPKIAYVKKRFTPDVLATIAQVNQIADEYAKKGLKLTLRQLYYQLVGRGLRENTNRSYKQLGGAVSNGRLGGLIDWDIIEDRTREVVNPSQWRNPAHIIDICSKTFRVDRWEDQPYRPEVWIEKEALSGVIAGVCNELHIPFLACRGYTSQSEMWSSAMRLKNFAEEHGQTPIILHFGDHDPSGIDMSRDIFKRLETFMGGLKVDRLALNMDQIRKFNPPPNPAKVVDPRFQTYQAKYGDESWELDALKPEVLIAMIRNAVLELRNDDILEEKMVVEREYRAQLKATSDYWPDVLKLTNKKRGIK